MSAPINTQVNRYQGNQVLSAHGSISEVLSSPDIALEILRNLDTRSIAKFSLVSRKCCNLTDQQALWRTVLERDFGKEIVDSVRDQNYKRAYKQCLYVIREIDLLPMNSMTLHSFSHSFSEAAANGNIVVMKMMMKSPRFKEMEDSDIGGALSAAIDRRQIASIRQIMQSPFANKISVKERSLLGLGDCFIRAAERNQAEAMKIIMQSPRFAQMNASELWEAFGCAIKYSQIDALKVIIQSPRYAEIADSKLKWLIRDVGLIEITVETFRQAFEIANGDFEMIINLLKYDDRFADMVTITRS